LSGQRSRNVTAMARVCHFTRALWKLVKVLTDMSSGRSSRR
jgi:hypothetical protein